MTRPVQADDGLLDDAGSALVSKQGIHPVNDLTSGY
jgi:hypothetical protein